MGVETIDPDHVALLRDAVGEEGLAEIARAFLAELPSLEAAILAAARAGDVPALRAALHTFEGAASNLGLNACIAFADGVRTDTTERGAPDPQRIGSALAEVTREAVRELAPLADRPTGRQS